MRACVAPIFRTTKKECVLSNAQSKFASVVLDGALGPLCLACASTDGVIVSFYVVPAAKYKASGMPLKGAVSAQKALEGSETEMRELV